MQIRNLLQAGDSDSLEYKTIFSVEAELPEIFYGDYLYRDSTFLYNI